ncbi:MAG: HAMP domain-containing histidine kinase [Prevotella sp.]|nr:HAMP domain-containing histidine kinase [Prevotella sp.]
MNIWIDRIRQVKVLLVAAAVVTAVASLLVSHMLTRDLAHEERKRMEIWAEAMDMVAQADETTDVSLALSVIESNTTIPVIVTDRAGSVADFRNIALKADSRADSLQRLKRMAADMRQRGDTIRVMLGDDQADDYLMVGYDESVMLRRLAQFPYWQLGVVFVLAVVAIFALLSSKRAEQNKVWVGLSKETAHQLGTPISSLMAWVEIMKENYPADELVPEMQKDVERLQLVAERFSKIGSKPEAVETSLNDVLQHVCAYMDRRTSRRITISSHLPPHDVRAMLNGQLFEWVLENLCKNAVDAMDKGAGSIDLWLFEEAGTLAVEVTDNGKGMRKKDVKNVFRPGFTTKKRGWGLGLSLARRIVEQYHHGRIFVKWTEVGRGTTFRIELKTIGSSDAKTIRQIDR